MFPNSWNTAVYSYLLSARAPYRLGHWLNAFPGENNVSLGICYKAGFIGIEDLALEILASSEYVNPEAEAVTVGELGAEDAVSFVA